MRHYAVEYDIPSLAFAVTDHSAEDETYIGTNAKYTPQPGDKTVTAIIDGNSKVYDGVQISPSAFTVYGAEGASESLFNITYTVEQGSYASYSPRTVNGSSWRDTGAVNAARYHAVAALTDAAIKAGWKLSDDSVLECDLIIYQRPINVYSYHNNRVYDQTNYSNGAIRVTDINVDPTGGFLITDKAPLDLLRGEMSMNMFGTQLVPGANTPANPERWIAAADESEGVDGVFLHLPLECYIAGGNVNDETVCTPVTKVQYTIAEYGKTVPEVDDAELPEYIHGEPVTPSTTG